ncbi:MAG TPA: PTS fructose transporter subunit IIC [Negativicutes bacterium]|nr:PTS fructose transporter subunit IIC [Negativicutes bacterium]
MATLARKGTTVTKISRGQELKAAFLTGTSYMIPVVVAGGVIQAIAKAIGGYNVAAATGTFAFLINQVGVCAMFFTVPVLTAAIAYSLADRPGIAPGLALGYLSVQLNAGFLGGVLCGLIIGYLVRWMKTWKVPTAINGLMPILVIPVLATLIVGAFFTFVIGKPVALATAAILTWMSSLTGGSRAIMGAVIGAMMGFDLGGPITKTAASFANALNADGAFIPTSAKMCAGMCPPLGMAVAVFLAKKKFTSGDMENAKAAVPLCFCYITEGAIPFAINDPLRAIPCTMFGSAVAGSLCMIFNIASPAVHGGIFVVPMMSNPLLFLGCMFTGALVTGVTYAIIKKPLVELEVAEA